MEKLYEVLDSDMQSHPNVQTALVQDRTTKTTKFCKVVEKNEQMEGEVLVKAIDVMTSIGHQNV